ncbi:uncharacterized protein [Nicotiana tomentosiformis]|uniref:uncharacterized protein isoform X1 n=1 Tax=Nicotiana tomentosiformis TaxID=4098 RepID=UPI00051BF50A|nr:telomere length regulation protein TEL2 homolog [Nicotiana tomentosiformis]
MEKEAESRRKREVDITVLEKVGQVTASIKDAKHVDQVICALHSLALLLFPLDSHSVAGSVNEQYREQLTSLRLPATHERDEWWQIFYKGPAFSTLARVLLYDVAFDWLACIPISVRMHVYDVFFLRGQVIEVVQKLVPCLQWRSSSDHGTCAVHSNAERLLVLCLLENKGVTQIARELYTFSHDLAQEELKQIISRVVQLLTSIPDKAQAGTPNALSSHLFFKHITAQLLAGAQEWDELLDGGTHVDKNKLGGGILLMGEAFARIIRRGSADVLLSVLVPELLKHVRGSLPLNSDIPVGEAFESTPGLRFWLKMIESIKDPYSVERMTEELLKQLAAQNTGDIEAHLILWILFHQIYQQQASIRSMFLEKFLLWKVFPSNCLRWILHFAVFQCSPGNSSSVKACNLRSLSETVQHLVTAWSKREFVQSTSIEQQAYITAALGLCLEKMSKEDLDATKDAMHCILEGVSCRLEGADHLVRKMASSVALAFSKVIDPQNPLYLDDSCREESIDWEFGLLTPEKRLLARSTNIDGDTKSCSSTVVAKELNTIAATSTHDNVMGKKKKLFEFESVDPDEIIDPASLNNEVDSREDDEDNASETSESSNDSSLQPYDLSDDDADLKRSFSQLVDVIGALRKSDDADGVDKAIDVAEKLIRASPDELKFVASDLARSLLQARCSDSTIEGVEESAEEKRQKALVALIVTCPHESLNTLNKLLYSPNLDVSQRLMILDVMTEAAQELASTGISRLKQRPGALISSMSDQAWFMPKPIGPPGTGPWKEISTPGTPLNWSHSYERELPPKPGQIKKGKTRRWSLHSAVPENHLEWSQNKFPQYAAAFMLPAMEGFDKKRHGVDLLGRDFLVLGKLIYMLGVCVKCSAMHPEASILASPLLELLRSREISHHVEAYVRRSVLFTSSCILISLHPSYVAAALVEGNSEISKGLEWVRTWALHIAESDTDRECCTLAMTCLQLHSEMALQTSRALESPESLPGSNSSSLPSNVLRGFIKIPNSSGGILNAP